MADIILTAVIVALLAERFLTAHRWTIERERLIHRIIADRPSDVALLDRTQDQKPFVYHSDNPLNNLDGYEGQAGLS